ncbi:MAG: DUF882 domain-containing protein [Proteobacteria bacterium]|nr:MAG: DUF882 domain-containing protein [Pseudomonadota bacterium]
MDPALLDTLNAMRDLTGRSSTYQIISGFHSPVTDEMLRNGSASSGTCDRSQAIPDGGRHRINPAPAPSIRNVPPDNRETSSLPRFSR